jgi:DNA-binding MarR family transcriptional regulator
MPLDPTTTAAEEPLSPRRLAPSAALLGAHIALTAALGTEGVAGTEHDQQTIDLLLRLRASPQDGMRAVNLSEQLMVSTSHMSRVIDKVEAHGLVKRRPDPDDRRANRVIITTDGCEVVAAVAPHIAATLDRVIHDTLTPGEIGTLIQLLGQIEHAARTPPATAAP